MHSIIVSCKSGYHIKDLRDKIFDIASQVKESIGESTSVDNIMNASNKAWCNVL